MRTLLCFVAACQLSGCSWSRPRPHTALFPPRPTTAATPAPSSSAAPAPKEEAALVSEEEVDCTGDSVRMVRMTIPKQSSSLRCMDGLHKCKGEVPVTIENCTGLELTIKSIYLEAHDVVGERETGLFKSKPWPAVRSGTRVTRDVEITYGASYEAYATVWSSKAGYGLASEGTVINTAYVAAKAACAACHGKWGPQGLLAMEGCVCRARDRGKTCYDADDCEGDCVYDHVEKLGGGLGRNAGKCSEFIDAFDCVSYLHFGESKLPPRPLAELGPTSRMCRD